MRWLRVLYIANGAVYGTFYAFVPVILTWHGFDAPLVAICGSIGSLAFWLALPVWGHLGDAVVGTRRALQLAAMPAAATAVALALPLPVLLVLLMCVAGSATGGAIGALTDAQCVSGLADPQREYGRLRMLGSLGGGVFAIVSGILYDHTGYFVAPIAGALATIAIAFIAVRIPQGHGGRPVAAAAATTRPATARPVAPAAPPVAPGHGRFGSVSDALNGRPRLIAILIGCLGIFIGIMGGGTFITLRLQALGGGPSTIGFANGLGASAEVPGMILASWLAVRYGIRPLLGVSALGLAMVFGTWALITEPVVITATKMAAGLFFAGVTVSFVITMATILPQRLLSTGQTLYQSVAFGAAAILANMAGAFIYKLDGTEAVFWFLAGATAIGGVISILALPAHTRVRVAAEPVAEPVALEPAAIEPLPVPGA
jgi:MFS family permease